MNHSRHNQSLSIYSTRSIFASTIGYTTSFSSPRDCPNADKSMPYCGFSMWQVRCVIAPYRCSSMYQFLHFCSRKPKDDHNHPAYRKREAVPPEEAIELSFIIGGAAHVFMKDKYNLETNSNVLVDLLKRICGSFHQPNNVKAPLT